MREYSIGISQELQPILSGDQVKAFLEVGQTDTFESGSVLYRQGEPADHIFLLLEGMVHSLLLNSNGYESLLRIHLPGSILGMTALATVPWRDASAKASKTTTTLKLRRNDVERLIVSDPSLGLTLIRLLVDRMRDFHFRVGELQGQTVEQRLARVLIAICQRDQGGLHPDGVAGVSLTHQELAHLVNARRQTVSAVLSQFADEGYIARVGRRLQLLDIGALSALIEKS